LVSDSSLDFSRRSPPIQIAGTHSPLWRFFGQLPSSLQRTTRPTSSPRLLCPCPLGTRSSSTLEPHSRAVARNHVDQTCRSRSEASPAISSIDFDLAGQLGIPTSIPSLLFPQILHGNFSICYRYIIIWLNG
jgi:hypothetical protein